MARGKPSETHGAAQLSDGGVPDRISLRDYTVSCYVGAFEEEKHSKQRVRFNIELAVTPSEHRGSDDVSHVVSYDMIVDAVHAVLGEGHINLLETIAERIAMRCLAHKRAVRIRILIEKLDRIEGASLGVEIERVKRPEA